MNSQNKNQSKIENREKGRTDNTATATPPKPTKQNHMEQHS